MSNEASNDVKDKGGRPFKMTDELIAKAELYLTDYMSNDDIVPSVAGLACYLGVTRKTIYNHKDKNERLLHTLEMIEQIQEKLLLKGGLLGDFNPTITKLMMSNHGYSDKAQIDNVSSDGSMKPTVIELVAPKFDDES